MIAPEPLVPRPLPVATVIFPAAPLAAFPVEIVTLPDGDDPDAPPVARVTLPEAASVGPVDSASAPLVPPTAPPLPSAIAPVSPDALLPLCSVNEPLAPPVLALALRMETAPLELDVLPPDRTLIAPPVMLLAVALPAATDNRLPTVLALEPTSREIVPPPPPVPGELATVMLPDEPLAVAPVLTVKKPVPPADVDGPVASVIAPLPLPEFPVDSASDPLDAPPEYTPPVAMVTPPVLVVDDVPELNTSRPLLPPLPVALALRTVTAPDPAGPAPLAIHTLPPDNAVAVAPALNTIEPPLPLFVDPTTTLTLPALPLMAEPEAMLTPPAEPLADAPVLSVTTPEDVYAVPVVAVTLPVAAVLNPVDSVSDPLLAPEPATAEPVDTRTAPLPPVCVVPELNSSAPLAPALAAFADAMYTTPLVAVLPDPDSSHTAPPDTPDARPAPAARFIAPP